ncbi:SDR family NAD(P)-dependent oxidoreductase [Microcystis aeruginosa]|nr:type I polyketide synthase [Microcystis aeruginosa]
MSEFLSPHATAPAMAIVGMACCYPDARSPRELWENVLAQRRAFRQIPRERLSVDDYFSSERTAPDAIYSQEAALIEGYEFDRAKFRVAGSTYRSADLAHWLALDVAAQALADAGFSDGQDLPRETTGVLLGNTLTGEFSRANSLRLRWPYVRRILEAKLLEQGMADSERQTFLRDLEAQYKDSFPPIGEESLAGNLSNTIAGRICNHFDLQGGGYVVDGACSSSLLAVANACSALVAGDLDVALAGGVDLSLDPFELVGFAKVGALAEGEMWVYDRRSAGFIPGEGCGFIVLMRYEDALAQQRRIYSLIRGWGISSDGNGGITRPEVEGQLLAIQRAYQRAGFGLDTVGYLEGHGTGTRVGDTAELTALSRAREEAFRGTSRQSAAIGSIKANIGHTKAAAGMAGLIKATMAVYSQILPPNTACEQPHSKLTEDNPPLKPLKQGQLWPESTPLRAGVSAMGFGGINTHVVLEGVTAIRRQILTPPEQTLLSSAQDAELILLGAENEGELQQKVQHLLTIAPRLSRAEVGDLAAELARGLTPSMPCRAAIVTAHPQELTQHLETLSSWLSEGEKPEAESLSQNSSLFLSRSLKAPRIGFLFPGQAAAVYLDGGAWERRFPGLKELYQQADLPQEGDPKSTAVAQPAIVTASAAGLRLLEQLGINAEVAVGHSLGELCALHWAQGMDAAALIRLAKVRGKAMADLRSSSGAMASIGADAQAVRGLLNGKVVAIAGFNSPGQTVISGDRSGVLAAMERAQVQGWRTVELPVSHAFHSPLVAGAAQPLAQYLARQTFSSLRRRVVSTVTGFALEADEDLRALLVRQITNPVQFQEAATTAAQDLDLLIEVGPGRILSGLCQDFLGVPAIPLDAGGPSLKGLLQAAGAAFALGVPIKHLSLYASRFTRPFNLDWHPQFFANPCELAPVGAITKQEIDNREQQTEDRGLESSSLAFDGTLPLPSSLECVRQLVAHRVELPPASVKDDHRLLSDLHLNSITVGQLVAEAARILNLSPPMSLTDYADATVAEIAQALEHLSEIGNSAPVEDDRQVPSGVDSWIRTFTVEWVERPLLGKVIQPNSAVSRQPSAFKIIAPAEYPLAEALEQAFTDCEGSGVVVCLPPNPDESHIDVLLQAAQALIKTRSSLSEEGDKIPTLLVLVQHGGGTASFARTFYLENPQITTCVVDLPLEHPQATAWVVAEAQAAQGYWEAYYDATGIRHSPVLRLFPLPVERRNPKSKTRPQDGLRSRSVSDRRGPQNLKSEDVLLITGGGKGIAAECALALAQDTGVRLALLGRSKPENDAELSNNLARMQALGIQVQYLSVDVTDAQAVRTAVSHIEADLGTITAILHGAGVNTPKLIKTLDKNDFLSTLAPKVQGLRHLLAAIDPEKLRILVAFGSIIGRTGLPGEADYAVANEWLGRLVDQFKAQYSHCHCLTLDWSVWSGAGMGERLGRIDALMQQGITPISPDTGIAILRRLMGQSLPVTSVVVTGRFGEPPTLKVERPELPFLRFLEKPRAYYRGVELIVDAELSTDTDPYLNDHIYEGERIFPGVMGLEAMAQVAMGLLETSEIPVFEDVQFHRPVVVAETSPLKIRLAALVRESGKVEVVLRSEQTGFAVEHFRATLSKAGGKPQATKNPIPNPIPPTLLKKGESQIGETQLPHAAGISPQQNGNPNPFDPKQALYGNLLFHRGRFQRLREYRHLRSTECIAEIEIDSIVPWFSRYLPTELVLGDPGARDAVIHALQACVPHATLLPVGIERLTIYRLATSETCLVVAKERQRSGDTFIYDLQVLTPDGEVLERWEGLTLQIVQLRDTRQAWVAPLLAPYLERQIREFIPTAEVAISIDSDGTVERRVRSDRALLVGQEAMLTRRPDGKPELTNGKAVSVAHAGDLTLVVTGAGSLGADVESVVSRSVAVWRDLLGGERFALAEAIASQAQEGLDTAATRVWTASECLKKAGATVNAPLTLLKADEREVWLESGEMAIGTFAVCVGQAENQLNFAVLTKQRIVTRKA